MSSRQYIEQEVARRVISGMKEASRREKRNLRELKKLLQAEDYQLLSSTESLGLFGDIVPMTHEDWKLLQSAKLLVLSLLRSNTMDEIQPFIDILKSMYADAVARSSSKEVIQYLFGDIGKGAVAPGYQHSVAGEE